MNKKSSGVAKSTPSNLSESNVSEVKYHMLGFYKFYFIQHNELVRGRGIHLATHILNFKNSVELKVKTWFTLSSYVYEKMKLMLFQ